MKLNLEFNHLKEVKQGYKEHAKDALTCSAKLLFTSVKLVVHAVWPDVFTDDASNTCKEVVKMSNEKRAIFCDESVELNLSELNGNDLDIEGEDDIVFENKNSLEDSKNYEEKKNN